MLTFLTVFVTLVCSLVTALLVPLRQRKFRIKDMTMLILSIIGYALTVLIWTLVPVLYYRAGIELDVLFVIPLAVAVPYVVAVVLTEFLTARYRRKMQQADEEVEDLAEEEAEQPVETEQSEEVAEAEPTEEITQQDDASENQG